MPASTTALVRGTLDMLILRALRWEPTHGAGVAEWMRLVTNGTLQVEEGTLYPALRRLEQRGMIESEWGASERHRKARYYQLTPLGRQWFWSELEKWDRYVDTMNRVLRIRGTGSIRRALDAVYPSCHSPQRWRSVTRLVLGFVLLFIALIVLATASGHEDRRLAPGRGPRSRAWSAWGFCLLGVLALSTSSFVVIDAGSGGGPSCLRQGRQRPACCPACASSPRGRRWSASPPVRSSGPAAGEQAERIPALSSEQMGMNIDAAVRWQIDPQQAPRIYTEIGGHEQIESVVQNAIRNGVRDGMSAFSINQIADRNMIADRMRAEVDSALETRPRAGGPPFRIAEITAFFLATCSRRNRWYRPSTPRSPRNSRWRRSGTGSMSPAPGRTAAAAQPDPDARGAHQAVSRGAGGNEDVEQPGDPGARPRAECRSSTSGT